MFFAASAMHLVNLYLVTRPSVRAHYFSEMG
jgi:hypothetical protein